MKPKNPNEGERSQLQLFQARLDSQLNPDHPLFVLAGLIDWNRFDQAYATLFCPDNGAPALPTRLMVALEYLKYIYNLSDEELVARRLENPYRQYFCGEDYFRTNFPLHYTSLGKWRLRIGTEKLKLVHEETIRVAKEKKFVTEKDLFRVIVDTTVQEKNVAFPTDSKLLARAIVKLGKQAKHHKIKLRQSYSRSATRKAQALCARPQELAWSRIAGHRAKRRKHGAFDEFRVVDRHGEDLSSRRFELPLGGHHRFRWSLSFRAKIRLPLQIARRPTGAGAFEAEGKCPDGRSST